MWLLTGNLVFMAGQYFVLVALTQRSASDAGVFVLATALATPIFALANLRLRQAYVADMKGASDFDAYRKVRYIAMGGGAVASLAIGSLYMRDLEHIVVLCYVVVARAGELGSDLGYAILQAGDRFRDYGVALCLRGVLGAAAFWTSLQIGLTPINSLAVWAATSCFTWLALDSKLLPEPATGARSASARDLAKKLAPLGLAAFLVSLSASVPRLVVESQVSLEQLATFGILMAVYGACLFALETVADVLLRPLAVAHHAEDGSAASWIVAVGASGGAAVASMSLLIVSGASDGIARVLPGEPIARQGEVLAVLALALGLQVTNTAIRVCMIASQAFRDRLATESVALLTVAVGCVLFVPSLEVLGAAYALLLSALVQACLAFWFLTRARRRAAPRDAPASSDL